jgi:hypothetical protein
MPPAVLVTAVAQECAQARRVSLTYRSLGLRGPVEKEEEQIPSPALNRLAKLIAQHDVAPIPQRRGGAHPGRTNATPSTSPPDPRSVRQ